MQPEDKEKKPQIKITLTPGWQHYVMKTPQEEHDYMEKVLKEGGLLWNLESCGLSVKIEDNNHPFMLVWVETFWKLHYTKTPEQQKQYLEMVLSEGGLENYLFDHGFEYEIL